MAHQNGLSQWTRIVSSHLPNLSWNQLKVLSEYSYGMVLTRRSGMNQIADFVAKMKGEKPNTVRQRLREWNYDAADKAGKKRQAVAVASCFVWLVSWIVSWWRGGEKRLVLAMDASSLGQVFTVLSISLVYRGCALPVAWKIVPGNAKGAWKDHWLGLLKLIHPAVPRKWCVLVLTDRGLYAKWLYQAIRRYHWQPFMRINVTGQYRLRHGTQWRPLKQVVSRNGRGFARRVTCFKTKESQLNCTLLACWQAPYKDPWLIVTSLPVSQANIAWYGMRAWIEAGFKDFKRGGWHWEQTKMQRPERAERLWLVMTVAMLWTLSVGGEADLDISPATIPDLLGLSCFTAGVIQILVAVCTAQPIPVGRFYPAQYPPPPL